MMQPARLSAIVLCATTLLGSVTLSGCDDSGADTAAPPGQTTADASLKTDATPVAQDTATQNTAKQDAAAQGSVPEPSGASDPAPVVEPTTAPANDPAPASAEQTQPPAKPRTPSATPVNVTFDDIKLDLVKDEPFVEAKRTERLNQLDGERVRIRGFILPGYTQSGLTQFVLVRDNMQCCFGPGAALFDCIVVEMQGDATAEFSVRPVAVEGVFNVQVLEDPDGRQLAIYHLAGEDVR